MSYFVLVCVMCFLLLVYVCVCLQTLFLGDDSY